MKTRLLYLLALLVLVGCAKDADENKPEEPAELFCFPERIVEHTRPHNGEPYTLEQRFVYDEQNQLTGIKYYASGNMVLEDTYEYDQKGLLVRENWFDNDGELSGYYDQTYSTTGQLLSFTYYTYNYHEQKATLDRKSDFAYNAAGELTTLRHYRPANGALEYHSSNEYTYTSGLITKVRNYDSTQQLIKETVLTYDDKKTYMRGLPAYRAQRIGDGFPHEHNVMTKTVKDATGNVIAAESYARGAEYNSRDYVELQFTTYGDGRVQERHYTYICPKE
ncbi:hypothetical protein [uncultured Pontibacter sp.]|uniref:hypothetical protein n=1 Tax=uncultured Pontibacter sp. TaxID=453356 RepID=UPI00262E0192|nr:hypothetical protein [uncultured Pontibacter sp.]